MKFKDWLEEEIKSAREEFNESRVALNSYGHGYDTGWLDALKLVQDTMNTFQEFK